MSRLDNLFDVLKGKELPGGCDLCDAYQTLTTVEPGIHSLTVHHDDWCPVWRSMQAGSN